MWLFLLSSIAAFANFYLLLAVVPLYAGTDNANTIAAGVATGSMMAATVLTELATPWLLAKLGYRYSMAAGIALLGIPALLLPISPDIVTIVLVSLLRGTGLAILVVAGTSLAADLAPEGRRGEGLGLYGLAVSVPSIIGLPAGVWLAEHLGYTPVFLIAAATAGIALLFMPALPNHRSVYERTSNILSAMRRGMIARPVLVFASTTMAAGVIVTFLPLALGDDAQNLATIALLIQSGTTSLARWLAGRIGDSFGSHRLILPAVVAAATGALCLTVLDMQWLVVIGITIFGVGFGIAQNATLSVMFERVPKSEFGQISALWNLAFDAGLGIGAVGFGFLATWMSYGWSFAIVAAVIFIACLLAIRDQRSVGREPSTIRSPNIAEDLYR